MLNEIREWAREIFEENSNLKDYISKNDWNRFWEEVESLDYKYLNGLGKNELLPTGILYITLLKAGINFQIKKIFSYMFSGIDFTRLGIDDFVIPDTVEIIDLAAFPQATLNNLTIPKTIRYIDEFAFNFTYIKSSVTLPEKCKSWPFATILSKRDIKLNYI